MVTEYSDVFEPPGMPVERAIKAHRKRGRRLEFLVQWLGYSSAHDEWLKEEDLGNAQTKLRAYKRANGLP